MDVEFFEVSYSYGGKRSPRAEVRDLTFHWASGSIHALLGPSGAGKSTLLQGLQGFLRPVQGRLTLGGVDPWGPGGRQTFARCGTLLQNPGHQLFAPTVRLDVAFGLRSRRLPAPVVHRRVDEALDRVGLDPLVYGARSPWELSGGEQRRVALAGLLVNAPDLLLLDEPTAGLDAPSRARVFQDIRTLAAQGTTVVWTSHDLEEVWEHAPDLLVLAEGCLVAQGPSRGLLEDPDLAQSLGWDPVPAVALATPWGVRPDPDPEVVAQRIGEVFHARGL